MAYIDPLRPEAPPRPIQRIALYERDGEGVYLQADNGPVWCLVGLFLEHTFDFDAPAWLGGTRTPDKDFLRPEWSNGPPPMLSRCAARCSTPICCRKVSAGPAAAEGRAPR